MSKQAFNAGGKDVAESLKPVKESLVSILQLQSTNNEANTVNSDETEQSTSVQENNRDTLSVCDKYPAPSTPQLKQCVRSLDDGECQDQANLSMEQDSVEQDGESKSVETTYCNSVSETVPMINPPVLKQERETSPEQGRKNDNSSCSESKDAHVTVNSKCGDPKKPSGVNSSTGTKANKKKLKVRCLAICYLRIVL